MELETHRLKLRQWRDDDLAAFAALNRDPDVMQFFPNTLSRQESDDMAARIRHHIDVKGWGLWAVEVLGTIPFIGFVGLAIPRFDAPFTPCVEVGWRLARPAWGRGFATEAAQAAVSHALGPLGLTEIVSFTTRDNSRSRAVMERIGMQRDPADDFDHPSLDAGHPQRPHVLYRITRPGDRPAQRAP
jgi:ribosomal-protein-alanine N-acetyltransferase